MIPSTVVYPATSSPPPIQAARASMVGRRRSMPLLARWHLSPQQAYLWGLGLGSFTLGLVNGALVISAGIGVLAYRQLVQLSPAQQQALRERSQAAVPLPRALPQQALVLSLLLGASTYTVTALWQSTHSLLMALVLTGQTALTFFVVVALLRSPSQSSPEEHPTKRADADTVPAAKAVAPAMAIPPTLDAPAVQLASPVATLAASEAARFEQTLAHLTHPDPLQRLIAVRQLVRLVSEISVGQDYIAEAGVSMPSHLLDCFHVMLAHEPEPIVRSAVRESLALLRQSHQLPAGADPLPEMAMLAEPDPWLDACPAETPTEALATPALVTPPKAAASARRTVEYIEYLDI